MTMQPPPGPFRPGFWRCPLRGPWLTSVLGAVLLVGISILVVTGVLSYATYNLVASFALAGYGAVRLVPDEPVKVTVWFIGAVIGHDLILFPLYVLADRSVTTILDRRRAGTGGHVRAAINSCQLSRLPRAGAGCSGRPPRRGPCRRWGRRA